MLRLKAYAKINLYLKVNGIRPDGFHSIDSIMQTVDLYDEINIEKAKDVGVIFEGFNISDVNSVTKAAEYFFCAAGVAGGAHIVIKKHIPECSGLGGASADAAATLKGLNKIYNTPLEFQDLLKIGAKIGSDVPFCIMGGACRAQGRGEIITPIVNNLGAYYLLLKPRSGVSTAAAYTMYDKLPKDRPGDIEACIHALRAGNMEGYRNTAFNSFDSVVKEMCKESEAILQALENNKDSVCIVSGSGSTCIGVFECEKAALGMQQQMLNWDLDINHIVKAIS